MLLKELYSKDFFLNLSSVLQEVLLDFNPAIFLEQIFDEDWNNKELKQRMKHTTFVLNSNLSKNFDEACKEIISTIKILKQRNFTKYSLEFMFFPDYIETYGINYFNSSIKAIEFITQFTSCEFAVRPFIKKYPKEMMQQMKDWSLHKNEHVRRLSTEGCRPRLPWAMALQELKKNPATILPILENLKQDPSDYVRRSVANNLNDITKDNPQIVIEIAKKCKGNNIKTDSIIKHGVRNLLKQGNSEILNLYGLKNINEIELKNFEIKFQLIKTNNYFPFCFTIKNNSTFVENIRLEYAIYFLLKNGKQAKKVFKISERELMPNQEIVVERKHNFKIITTRKFYEGKHKISIILNGKEKIEKDFMLVT